MRLRSTYRIKATARAVQIVMNKIKIKILAIFEYRLAWPAPEPPIFVLTQRKEFYHAASQGFRNAVIK